MRFLCSVLLLFFAFHLSAQQIRVNASVTAAGSAQANTLIDLYEYNSPIQPLHTDAQGRAAFQLQRGKEYLIVVYKSGFITQSISISDSKFDKLPVMDVKVELQKDPHTPDGLYYHDPLRRIESNLKLTGFTDDTFALTDLPQRRGDSVTVLMNRARANQYLLVSRSSITATHSEGYSRQVVADVQAEAAHYGALVAVSDVRYDSLYKEEQAHLAATQHTTGDKQYDELLAVQKDLAGRLGEKATSYLMEQQRQLARARLDEMNAIRYEQRMNDVRDSSQRMLLRDTMWQLKARAAHDRWRASDANKKFLWYNKYQTDNYQEYVEMLRYKEKKSEAKPTAQATIKKSTPPHATPALCDTSDNLSKLSDAAREDQIRKALEEEERFKNYDEKTEHRRVDGTELTVQQIRISDDTYEIQIDNKGGKRYFKNRKPITSITFDFETKRKMVDVLNTIHMSDKLGR
ncbi:MAG: hypothetical protein JSS76_16005 [Bacteroidetes bacterium]|nr:hypothetical protein [Bacteroidota bacterium]